MVFCVLVETIATKQKLMKQKCKSVRMVALLAIVVAVN
jgi:hypothetical protein